MSTNTTPELFLDDIVSEVWRLRSLIDACVHLFPESRDSFEHEDELLAILGVTQQLMLSLEYKVESYLKPSIIEASKVSEDKSAPLDLK